MAEVLISPFLDPFFLIQLIYAAENSPTHAPENKESTTSNQAPLINILISNETITLRCCDVTVSFNFDTEATRNLNTQYINLQLEVKATRLYVTWDSRITAKVTMIILKPGKRL